MAVVERSGTAVVPVLQRSDLPMNISGVFPDGSTVRLCYCLKLRPNVMVEWVSLHFNSWMRRQQNAVLNE